MKKFHYLKAMKRKSRPAHGETASFSISKMGIYPNVSK